MLGLTAVIAIAASCAAIFIVVSVVGIIVWVRYRKERHALALLGFRQKQGQLNRGLQSYPVDTLTELSQAEGSILRAHGQLPYGKPGEWGQLTSRESLYRPKHDSDSSISLTGRARSLRNSLSRSRSKRLSRSSHHRRMSSLATLSESVKTPSPPPKSSISKEDVPLSAIEGVLELPAERTPNQTPDPNEDDTGFLGMRPDSTGWPLSMQRTSLFPVSENRDSGQAFDPTPMVFDESPRRLRGTSIASQTPGVMPDHSVPPPPPTAYPTDRFSYARNDSIMRLSSMSLDTTNSSILETGPRSADTDLTSPAFSSGGTFVPFSAADVGVKDGRRSFISTNTSIPPMHSFPVRSASTTESRHKSPSLAPRRSMTTARYSGASADRFSGAPRRTDSLSSSVPRRTDSLSSSNPPSRHASLRSGTPVMHPGYQNPNASDWRFSGSQWSNQQCNLSRNSTVYEHVELGSDPFYVGSPGSGTVFHPVGSPSNTGNTHQSPSPMHRRSLSMKGPLPSALKGANPQRKGHRRQNCVRISIHPPITFGSSSFAPTVEEEPEEFDRMEEVDLRESTINSPKPLPSLPPSTTSPQSGSRRSKYGSRHGKPGLGSLGPLVEEPQPPNHDDTPCKKKRRPTSSVAGAHKASLNHDRALPEIFTALPPSNTIALTHTPSPERVPAVWEMSDAQSPTHENTTPMGSPRRSAVKGPRTQPSPIATRSHSTRVSSTSSNQMPESPLASPNRIPLVMSITGTEGSDWRMSTESMKRTRAKTMDPFVRREHDLTSLGNGLGPIGGSSAVYGNRRSALMQNRVTIYEDASQITSPRKSSVLTPVGTFRTPESTPSPVKKEIPRSLPANPQFPPHLSSSQAPPTSPSPRRGMTTPTGKSLGLGIGTATPASLYDGDGFLRE
ncbi:uncharacterized protein N7515_000785 [Penicillium bovifimosum]|uniref:Uncharacterized protein n=1 Tax=Penicillium bovifimosum TaxID=126998 RepID=A0A9W9HGA4_9EURO|nr:uncharacterized protein N7515_000785 [Penicillium bovifimosum]KAJ5146221.1 hypothetical protein N7515_000785 [Penicillium bovifimosum]